jgi:hypothetical protein
MYRDRGASCMTGPEECQAVGVACWVVSAAGVSGRVEPAAVGPGEQDMGLDA